MADELIDEGFITTGIDKFMRILFEKKKVELTEVSKELNIPQETVEYWSYVLENQGLVRISYTLTTVYLEWIGS
jgi:predicted transcriptional regulator